MKKVLILIVVMLVVGCSRTTYILPDNYTVTNSKEVTGEYDKIWDTAVSNVAKWNLALEYMDKESGFIKCKVLAGTDFVDCGKLDHPVMGSRSAWGGKEKTSVADSIPQPVVDNSFGTINIKISELDVGSYRVSIYVFFHHYRFDCVSTGALEKMFLDSF
jgi:hypothetical protein